MHDKRTLKFLFNTLWQHMPQINTRVKNFRKENKPISISYASSRRLYLTFCFVLLKSKRIWYDTFYLFNFFKTVFHLRSHYETSLCWYQFASILVLFTSNNRQPMIFPSKSQLIMAFQNQFQVSFQEHTYLHFCVSSARFIQYLNPCNILF